MSIAERLARLSANCTDVDAILVASEENRRYLSGFSGSSGAVLVHHGQGSLITDFRYWEQAERESPDLDLIRQEGPMLKTIAAEIERGGYHRVGYEAHQLTVETLEAFKRATPNSQWVSIAAAVESLRVVKTSDEIEYLRQAADIAGEAVTDVLHQIQPGIEELEIAVELEYRMRKLGSTAVSFDTIVVSGPRSSLPHGKPTRRRCQAGDMITIDFGATVNGYHSDETVTVGLGPVEAEAKTVYDVVCWAQSLGLKSIAPGVRASQVDQYARAYIEQRGYGPYFGHSTGHGVGLEVHEAPWAARQPATDWILEPGMVLTVEPGIYLPGRLGVRLEDTVVVTEIGYDRVTKVDKAWREL